MARSIRGCIESNLWAKLGIVVAHDPVSDSPDERAPPDLALEVARTRAEQAIFARQSAVVHVGRYVLLERIGSGAMGIVYAAFDSRLGRKVALKLLRFEAQSESQRRRMLREAQVLAKLSHPNVVPVYDAGTLDAGPSSDDPSIATLTYIAMELVDGVTVRQWLEQSRRPWREIVTVFEQAARGLLAAHTAGIVHRDFKPENVMLGGDQLDRVRVMDFGLARPLGSAEPTPASADGASVASSSVSLTSPGAIVGTPLYMAPEQLAGGDADHRADQYAFCVAFFEALHARRPFAGHTIAELLVEKSRGLAPERAGSVPRWLHDLIRRGLSPTPGDRFPSMEVLVHELSRRPAVRRRAAAAGAVVIGATVAAWAGAAVSGNASARCPTPEERHEVLWSAERRQAVVDGITAVALPFVDEAADDATRLLDAYATAWAEGGTEACVATHERLLQSTDMLDLRMGCLERAHREFNAVIDLFEHADASVAARASEIVSALPSPTTCSDTETLAAAVPPPEDEGSRVRVEQSRADLAGARALRRAGRHDEALSIVERVATTATELSYGALDAEVALERGTILDRIGQVDPAEGELRKALRLAIEWDQWPQAFDSIYELATSLGKRARSAEARAFLEIGWGLLPRTGFGPADEARLRRGHASVLLEEARFAEAEAELRRAIELTVKARGPDSAEEADCWVSMAGILFRNNRYEDAEAAAERARTILLGIFGPDHPRLVLALNNLANASWLQQDYASAEHQAREALRIATSAFGDDHIDIALARATLGVVLTQAGRSDEALPHLRRSLEIRAAKLGPDDPQVGRTHNSLAVALTLEGAHSEAELHLREVIRSDLKRLGDEHPHLVRVRLSLVGALLEQGKVAEARAEFDVAAEAARHSDALEARDHEHQELTLLRLLIAERRLEEAEALARKRVESGADEESTAFRRAQLSHVLEQRGWFAEALEQLESASTVLSQRLDPADGRRLQIELDLGVLAGEVGRWEIAEKMLEDVRAKLVPGSVAPAMEARLAFALARALDHRGRSPERAHALAHEALELYRSRTDEAAVEQIRIVETWLRARSRK